MSMTSETRMLTLYSRTFRRSRRKYGARPWASFGSLNPEVVFVVGSPRSGTSFTATAIGSVPGFLDLGEVPRLKAAIPNLYALKVAGDEDRVARRAARIVRLSERVGMAAPHRAIEQTPETTFLVTELARVFPEAQFVHLIRDGRDVAASLIDRGWLAGGPDERVVARAEGNTQDDAGQSFGAYPRFWVESGRESEFVAASEATRAAWVWRRYEEAAQAQLGKIDPSRVVEIRYEDLAAAPQEMAVRVAAELRAADVPDSLGAAFRAMHARSVGRFHEALGPDQISDIEIAAGALLHDLGYC
jgi:hypothetical protein